MLQRLASGIFIVIGFCCLTHLSIGQFSFSYDGPDTLYVDQSCTVILDWGHPATPTASPTVPGQVIIRFEIETISGGFAIGDSVPAGQVVTVFYEAQDNMGHFALFGFNIFVLDTINPVFIPSTLPDDVTLNCAEEIPVPIVEATDNCESDSTPIIITFDESAIPDFCSGGTYTRTWIAMDDFENSSMYVQSITVLPDTTPPVILQSPVDGSAECGNAMMAYEEWLSQQRNQFNADDSGCGFVELIDNAPPPQVLQAFCGEITVDFFAIDTCGNQASVSAVFQVTNSIAPTITAEAMNDMADCSFGNPVAEFNSWLNAHGGAEATDDCSFITWSTIPESPSLSDTCNAGIVVEFVADDGCGNTASTSAEFFIQDTMPPTITNDAQNRVINCSLANVEEELRMWISNFANASATDFCTAADDLDLTYHIDSIQLDSAGIIQAFSDSISTGCADGIIIDGILFDNVLAHLNVDFAFSDVCGNSVSTSAVFGITDALGPSFTIAPADVLVTCDSPGDLDSLFLAWYNSAGGAQGEDDCGTIFFRGDPVQEIAIQNLAQSLDTACQEGPSVTIDFYINDFCGNENPVPGTATFRFIDSIPPVIITPASDLISTCDTAVQSILNSWLDASGGAIAIDACGLFGWSFQWIDGSDTIFGIPFSGPYPNIEEFGCGVALDFTFIAEDLCGGQISTSAHFEFIDTIPPTIVLDSAALIFSCDSVPEADSIPVFDNCGTEQVTVHFVDSILMSGDTSECAQYNGALIRKWIAQDACGNIATVIQMIQISDTTAPAFIAPPDVSVECGNINDLSLTGQPQMVLDNCDPDPDIDYTDLIVGGDCAFTVERMWFVMDACGNSDTLVQNITVLDTLAPGFLMLPSDLTIACDFLSDLDSMNVLFTSWIEALGGAQFADSCGEVLFFVSEPGSYNLNDTTTFPGSPVQSPAVSECIQGQGNIAKVFADVVIYDDCGNARSAQMTFEVIDTIPPEIISCDSSFSIIADTNCMAEVTINPPEAMDQCLNFTDTASQVLSLPVSSENPGDIETPVNNMTFTFGLPVADIDFTSDGTLEIRLVGVDANDSLEYFFVLGENNTTLGITERLMSECDTGITSLSISESLLELWALDGVLEILLVPRAAFNNMDSSAINDICQGAIVEATLTFAFEPDYHLNYAYSLDGASRVSIDSLEPQVFLLDVGAHMVDYFVSDCSGNESICNVQIDITDTIPPDITCGENITVNLNPGNCSEEIDLDIPVINVGGCSASGTFSIQYLSSGATEIPLDTIPEGVTSIQHTFQVGHSFMSFFFLDDLGNTDTCTIAIELTDAQNPVASCQDITAFVHPSGSIELEILAEDIDGGSTDNCGIDSMWIDQGIFPCDSAGTTQDVVLFIADVSGNQDSCIAGVRIEVQPLEPTYTVGICENDTLQLFANVPAVPGNPYTFEWTGPNNFTSFLENPIIPSASPASSGTYVVSVTGLDGCMTQGALEVAVDDLNAPELTAESFQICLSESVILQATEFTQAVTYMWFRGQAPNGLLLGTTINPTFIDIPPAAGDFEYYIIVESSACTSNPSQSVFVSIIEQPVAAVCDPFITVCNGEPIALCTDINLPGLEYQWSGPDGFSSDVQFPEIIENSTSENAGQYMLVLSIGDCVSDPAFVEITVTPRPDTPLISGDDLYCAGANLILTVNNMISADQFIWTHPNGSSLPTTGNTLTLNDIGPEVDGEWKVIAVKDGCSSAQSEPFSVNIEQLLISIEEIEPVCTGDEVTLTVPLIPGAMYQWSGPNAFISDEPNPTLVAMEGTYTVTVTTESLCEASASTFVDVNSPPMITALSNSAGNCADGTQTVIFVPTLFPADTGQYSFTWSGPNNFSSSLNMPTIENLTSADNGEYALIVHLGTCPSDTFTTAIMVTDIPEPPVISGSSIWCAGDTLQLSATGQVDDSVVYQWLTPLGNFNIENDSFLVIPDVNEDASGLFELVVSVNGCASGPSENFMVEVTPALQKPVVLAPFQVCQGDTLILMTEEFPGAGYFWQGPNGYVSNAQSPVIFPVDIAFSGTYTVQINIGSCLSEPSDPVLVQILQPPLVPVIEPFAGSVCLDDPTPIVLCIDESTATPGAQYTWYNAVSGLPLNSSSSLLCIEITDFSGFQGGLNGISVEAEAGGCRSALSIPISIDMFLFPDESAFAGDGVSVCLGDSVSLNALEPIAGSGFWLSLTPGASVEDPANTISMVSGLQEGFNQFVWSLSFESCLDYSRDTVSIFVESFPDLVDDNFIVDFGQTLEFNVTSNDNLPENYNLEIGASPGKGNALNKGNGDLVYTPNTGYVGEDDLTYIVCNLLCPDQCNEATIFLQVGDENDCFVPTIFTPNNDGVNDVLVIPCLETDRFPGNRIIIFNQWGDEVFGATPYSNDWDGKYKGDDLPVSTYFYVLDFGDGTPVRKGFLILER